MNIVPYVSLVVKQCQKFDHIYAGNLETKKEPSTLKAITDTRLKGALECFGPQ